MIGANSGQGVAGNNQVGASSQVSSAPSGSLQNQKQYGSGVNNSDGNDYVSKQPCNNARIHDILLRSVSFLDNVWFVVKNHT